GMYEYHTSGPPEELAQLAVPSLLEPAVVLLTPTPSHRATALAHRSLPGGQSAVAHALFAPCQEPVQALWTVELHALPTQQAPGGCGQVLGVHVPPAVQVPAPHAG